MSRISSDLWINLEQSRPVGDNLTARQVMSDTKTRLQCAIDSEGNRHFLIALDTDERDFRDTQSRGLSVITRDLVVRGEPVNRYLDIKCLDIAGYDVFDLIGGELVTALDQMETNSVELVKHVLAKWRRFWGQYPRTLLSREKILGLFAELWFLYVWLYKIEDLAEAVQRWRGPYGSRHDFEWIGSSVEVKATTSTRGRIYRINGIEQLLQPEEGRLFLFGLSLREEAGASNTLPGLISSILQHLNSNAEALSHFETALIQVGYSPTHNEEYSKIRLRIVEENLFEVKDDFPRLTPQQFISGVPSGIERLEYEINLNTFDHLIICNRPEKLSF